jgi:hypothetical protein
MDHELVAAIRSENDGLQQTSGGVEPQTELSCRTVVVEVLDPQGPRHSLDSVMLLHPVLEG